ncbi:MAG: hypothetical protein Kow00127_07610 [Bacteroidales bacterium]
MIQSGQRATAAGIFRDDIQDASLLKDLKQLRGAWMVEYRINHIKLKKQKPGNYMKLYKPEEFIALNQFPRTLNPEKA